MRPTARRHFYSHRIIEEAAIRRETVRVLCHSVSRRCLSILGSTGWYWFMYWLVLRVHGRENNTGNGSYIFV
jgi:hypothetical protein